MKNWNKNAVVLFVILALTFFTAGCSKKGAPSEQPPKQSTPPPQSGTESKKEYSPAKSKTEKEAVPDKEAIYEAPSSGIVGIENASMRPSSNATYSVTYKKDDGKVDFVLRVEDLNWTEKWGKPGMPVVIDEVVGKAGLCENADEARTNLARVQIKKDRNGAGIVYFDQTKPFRGVKRFYIRRSMQGYELDPVSLEALGFGVKGKQ